MKTIKFEIIFDVLQSQELNEALLLMAWRSEALGSCVAMCEW